MGRKSPIHIIEDDELVAAATAALLRVNEFAPYTYGSADQFRREVGKCDPGVILMDVVMPGTNGIAALQQLRAEGLDWPVIVVTATGDEHVEALAFASGAVEFLRKPYDSQHLVTVLKRYQA